MTTATGSTTKLAVGIEYDGGAFRGWQSQPCRQTVQDAVEAALTRVAGMPVRVFAAGRTDAGVHATLMPAHFAPPVMRQPSAWVGGANAHLPPAVRVLWAKPVAADFHARHTVIRRYYQYLLSNLPQPPALLRQYTGFCHIPLDVGAMRQAALPLLGTHDFSAFRAAACQAASPMRSLHRLDITRHGDMIIFEFCGDGFLHRMVRNIVGTLIAVGRGRQQTHWVKQLLSAGVRPPALSPAVAAGLYFNGADYPDKFRLPPCYRRSVVPARFTSAVNNCPVKEGLNNSRLVIPTNAGMTESAVEA